MHDELSINQDSEFKLVGILVVVLAFILGISLILSFSARKGGASAPRETSQLFPAVVLQAKAAYVYDIRNDMVLFAHNQDVRLPLASLTKVMSALVARELAPENGTITVSADALKAEGDTGLKRDERWSLKDIIDFSLVSSSNDGMRAVALALGAISKANVTSEEIINDFVGMMNGKASELGLKNTYFWNETGLDESDVKGGAYGSARDISTLMAHIMENYPELLSRTKEPTAQFESLDNEIHVAKNTNDMIADVPKLLASKTGYTNTAGGNLTIVFDPELGHPIVITVMGSSEKGRFDDMRALVAGTLQYLDSK